MAQIFDRDHPEVLRLPQTILLTLLASISTLLTLPGVLCLRTVHPETTLRGLFLSDRRPTGIEVEKKDDD